MAAVLGIVLHPGHVAPLPARDGPSIAAAKTWGYQLQRARARSIPDGIDLLVIDFARDGRRGLRPADVAALKIRADGRRRIVLAYMSIGEAENYRHYWKPSWEASAPGWLGPENPTWKGNYRVRYWEPDWQRIIVDPKPESTSLADKAARFFGLPPQPYIDLIIDAGFDGVYLDRVDAYDTPLDSRPTAKVDMTAFVARISQHAKGRKAGFLVVPQNGEELLAMDGYRQVIDGIAKEDLLYGNTGDGLPNSQIDIDSSVALLGRAKTDGKPVFVVEYLADPAQRLAALREISALGYTATFASRELDQPPEVPSTSQGAQPPAASH